jgi:hypothetical protein
MATYKIWVSCGESSFYRTYFNELGAVQLTEDQVSKYFTFDGDDNIEFDEEVLAKATGRDGDEDNSDSDFPNWDTITDGCMCWGPDAEDQNIGVCSVEDDENQIWMKPVSSLPYYSSEDIENKLPKEDEANEGIARIFPELDGTEGVWIVYNSYERGNYEGEFEIPDDEQFDPSKLVVGITEVAESWTIVSGIEYDGEDICCEGDTTGKGIDWYVYYKGDLHSF